MVIALSWARWTNEKKKRKKTEITKWQSIGETVRWLIWEAAEKSGVVFASVHSESILVRPPTPHTYTMIQSSDQWWTLCWRRWHTLFTNRQIRNLETSSQRNFMTTDNILYFLCAAALFFFHSPSLSSSSRFTASLFYIAYRIRSALELINSVLRQLNIQLSKHICFALRQEIIKCLAKVFVSCLPFHLISMLLYRAVSFVLCPVFACTSAFVYTMSFARRKWWTWGYCCIHRKKRPIFTDLICFATHIHTHTPCLRCCHLMRLCTQCEQECGIFGA